MKRTVKTISLVALALIIAVGGYFVLPLCTQESGSSYTYGDICPSGLPVLTASITSPANGAKIQVGDCFEVTATITATCPVAQFTSNFPFIKTVNASSNPCQYAATNVSATIAVTGNAQVQGAATQPANDLYCDGQPAGCPNVTTVSWVVCCTGPGAVTITVTPAGNSAILVGYNRSIDLIISTVYAREDIPIPAENLISDTITIVQEGEDFSQKLIEEPAGYAWSKPSDVRAINTWTNTRTVRAGQDVAIYANIANRGDIEGPYTATLTINGVVEEVKTGMLQPNTAVPLKFVVSRDEPGTYNVDINGQETFFTVVGDTSGTKAHSENIVYIIGIILLSAVIIALVYLIIHRRQQHQL